MRCKQREEKFVVFFQETMTFIRQSCDEKCVVDMFGKLRYKKLHFEYQAFSIMLTVDNCFVQDLSRNKMLYIGAG